MAHYLHHELRTFFFMCSELALGLGVQLSQCVVCCTLCPGLQKLNHRQEHCAGQIGLHDDILVAWAAKQCNTIASTDRTIELGSKGQKVEAVAA